ncbi:MAG TPA: hypothetical protein VNX18_09875 [Bryobacteraceae bacterium]|nr:hypothetical protein [Bryobacteraceae bacterium]
MPILQVRDLPDHIYRALVEQAEKERRSLAQQAIAVLAKGLQVELNPQARRREALRAIEALDKTPFKNLSDPAKLIREDRQR